MDGKPMADVSVSFQPAPGNSGPGSAGITDAEGRFSLETVGASRKQGAVAGKHIIRLTTRSQQDTDDDSGRAAASVLPPKAGDGTLTFDVPAEGTDKADFPLQSQ